MTFEFVMYDTTMYAYGTLSVCMKTHAKVIETLCRNLYDLQLVNVLTRINCLHHYASNHNNGKKPLFCNSSEATSSENEVESLPTACRCSY